MNDNLFFDKALRLHQPGGLDVSRPHSQEELRREKREKIATPEDWREYQKLRMLAWAEAHTLDASIGLKFDQERSEQEWRRELSRKDLFVVLSWKGSEGIGMGRMSQTLAGNWIMDFGYVKPEFRNQGVGKRIFATRLKEILRRGTGSVELMVEEGNDVSSHIAESFGFKKTPEDTFPKFFYMDLKDPKNPKTIKKIREVLNAG